MTMSSPSTRPLKNVQFVIANEVKQSHKPLIIKEIATAHMRLAMTGSEFFKALSIQSPALERIPQKVGGFTLMELLISMTLLLLIVVILGGAFRLGFRSLEAGEKRIEAIERFRTSVGIITAQLQSAVPLTYNEDGTKKSYFKGNAETLRFVSGYSIWGENQGTVIVSYRLESGDDGRWALFAAERGIGMEEIQEVKLFDKVKHFSFSYFGKDVAEEEGRWKTEWTDDTTTPEQVQITFERDRKEEKLLVSLYARIVTQPI